MKAELWRAMPSPALAAAFDLHAAPAPVRMRCLRYSAPLRGGGRRPPPASPTVSGGGSAPAAAAALAAAGAFALQRGRAKRRPTSTECQAERRSAAAVLGSCFLAGAFGAGVAGDSAVAEDGPTLMRQGMRAFAGGDVVGSIQLFDSSVKAGYPQDLLWQRGLSLYYADRFSDGAQQFRDDVAKNPNDTEESIWAMLCEARTLGFAEARRKMLTVGFDFRDVMRSVYALFRGDDEAGSLAYLQKTAQAEPGFLDGGRDQFYAALYLGLYAEAKGDAAEARRWIDTSVRSSYGKSSGDYMVALAKVHQKLRNAPAT